MHTPRKCLITIRPLIDKKLDKLLEQGAIVPFKEPTDWVSDHHKSTHGKQTVTYRHASNQQGYQMGSLQDTMLEEITHELAGSKKFIKVDGSSSHYYIFLDYESSLYVFHSDLNVHNISSRG